MDKKKTLILVLGVVCGMVFVYGLDVMTTSMPAKLQYKFLPWGILRYEVEARIDNLTVMKKDGSDVPVRYRYAESMEINYYFYSELSTGRRIVVMELLSKEIRPESIVVKGEDRTEEMGPGFAASTPAPTYLFFDFRETGVEPGRRKAAGIRDMIVSSYYTRLVPRETIHTGDTWSSEMDMGPFTTTYEWSFDSLNLIGPGKTEAAVSGHGEFIADEAEGGKGGNLGSFDYSYTIGIWPDDCYVKEAKGSFDLTARKGSTGTSYREEFTQKLVEKGHIPPELQESVRQEFESLKSVLAKEELGDAKVFHDSLVAHLRRFPQSIFWDRLLLYLNDLRVKCGSEPVTREELLSGEMDKPSVEEGR
jgi:hypothetical protein